MSVVNSCQRTKLYSALRRRQLKVMKVTLTELWTWS